MPDYSLESQYTEQGYRHICGVDEAGRGPLAGPVYAAAVILPNGLIIDGLNDSKKLSEKKRGLLFDIIIKEAVDYSIAFSTVEEIETYNILGATFLAMKRAVNGLKKDVDFALIDGNRMPPELPLPAQTVIKGDSLSCSIAAASVLAKVSRDRLLAEYDAKFPEYGFAKHKGYGTKEHYQAILEHGVLPIHRLSFLKNLDEHK